MWGDVSVTNRMEGIAEGKCSRLVAEKENKVKFSLYSLDSHANAFHANKNFGAVALCYRYASQHEGKIEFKGEGSHPKKGLFLESFWPCPEPTPSLRGLPLFFLPLVAEPAFIPINPNASLGLAGSVSD